MIKWIMFIIGIWLGLTAGYVQASRQFEKNSIGRMRKYAHSMGLTLKERE